MSILKFWNKVRYIMLRSDASQIFHSMKHQNLLNFSLMYLPRTDVAYQKSYQ